ncbi:hypothetical protein MRX96_012008 [Rhipicephalus microplus]
MCADSVYRRRGQTTKLVRVLQGRSSIWNERFLEQCASGEMIWQLRRLPKVQAPAKGGWHGPGLGHTTYSLQRKPNCRRPNQCEVLHIPGCVAAGASVRLTIPERHVCLHESVITRPRQTCYRTLAQDEACSSAEFG